MWLCSDQRTYDSLHIPDVLSKRQLVRCGRHNPSKLEVLMPDTRTYNNSSIVLNR